MESKNCIITHNKNCDPCYCSVTSPKITNIFTQGGSIKTSTITTSEYLKYFLQSKPQKYSFLQRAFSMAITQAWTQSKNIWSIWRLESNEQSELIYSQTLTLHQLKHLSRSLIKISQTFKTIQNYSSAAHVQLRCSKVADTHSHTVSASIWRELIVPVNYYLNQD